MSREKGRPTAPSVLKQTMNSKNLEDPNSYVSIYLKENIRIAESISQTNLVEMISQLTLLRANRGRLFILGVGGSAGNASHAVNDFRKITGIESYAPTDNVSELTAWINDEGWEGVFCHWLKTSNLNSKDALLILSVGGGTTTTSLNLVRAMEMAKSQGAKVLSIVSRDGGAAKTLSDVCVLIPVIEPTRITPHAEAWQSVVWHMLVNAL